MNAGKRFEQKFRESIEPHAYVLRIPDNVYMRGNRLMGNESEADFLVVTGTDSYLVECKATNRPSLRSTTSRSIRKSRSWSSTI